MGYTGAHSAFLDRSRKSKLCLIISIIITWYIYYFFYKSSYNFWFYLTYSVHSPYSKSLPDTYFLYINIVEFLSFIFVRTRTSIKYLPKFIFGANLVFLMYDNSYMYGCSHEALKVLQTFSFFIFAYFINNFEWAAVN